LIFVLGVLLVVVLVIGILYPDDPDDRVARMVRAGVTTFVFSGAFGVADSIITGVLEGSSSAIAALFTTLGIGLITAVPFSAAERLAGLLRPRRAPIWALVGIATCLLWSGVLYLLVDADGRAQPKWALVVEFIVPAIMAGFTWYAFLPKRVSSVGRIFE
jgi:hypothetical protein